MIAASDDVVAVFVGQVITILVGIGIVAVAAAKELADIDFLGIVGLLFHAVLRLGLGADVDVGVPCVVNAHGVILQLRG